MSHLLDEYGILTGDPEQIRGQVRELGRVAARMTSVAARLRELSVDGVWESGAGRAFASQIGSTPRQVEAVAGRLEDAAEAMRAYPDRLESSQRAMAVHDRRAAAAQREMDDKDRLLREMAPDDPQRVRVLGERLEAVRDLGAAERAFAREGKEAHDDEQRVAARLAVVEGVLTDSRGYDAAEGLEGLGVAARSTGPVGLVARSLAKPLELLGAAEPAGKAARRLFYDEGSWTGVAESGADYGLGVVTFGIRRIVQGVKRTRGISPTSHVPELRSRPQRVNDNPIAKPPASTNPPSRRARIARATRQHTVTTLKKKSGYQDLEDAFTDWEQVAGRGRVVEAAVVIEHSAKTGRRTVRNVTSATGAARDAGLDEDESQRRRRREADESGKRTAARRLGDGMPEDPRERKMV